MKQEMKSIRAIRDRFVRGEPLNPDDLDAAKTFLSSASPVERVFASTILLRQPRSPEVGQQVLSTVVDLCTSALNQPSEFTCDFAAMLAAVPLEAWRQHSIVGRAARMAATCGNAECRLNAMALLPMLARMGDREAVGLLKTALGDPDEYVRHNAKLAWSQLHLDEGHHES
jgi:hypothetical protein